MTDARSRSGVTTSDSFQDSDLVAAFHKYFVVEPVSTTEQLKEVFRLRFQVYCQEAKISGFDPTCFPDCQEHDEYDKRSVHALVRHKPDRALVGTVRLVLCDPQAPEQPFPIESFVGEQLDAQALAELPRTHSAEISRLILSRRFRLRSGEFNSPRGAETAIRQPFSPSQPHFPHSVLAILVAAFHLTSAYKVTHWLAGMEPGLNRLLKRFALELEPMGPLVEYYGLRRPYRGSVAQILARTYHRRPAMWNLLTDRGRLYPPPEINT